MVTAGNVYLRPHKREQLDTFTHGLETARQHIMRRTTSPPYDSGNGCAINEPTPPPLQIHQPPLPNAKWEQVGGGALHRWGTFNQCSAF